MRACVCACVMVNFVIVSLQACEVGCRSETRGNSDTQRTKLQGIQGNINKIQNSTCIHRKSQTLVTHSDVMMEKMKGCVVLS